MSLSCIKFPSSPCPDCPEACETTLDYVAFLSAQCSDLRFAIMVNGISVIDATIVDTAVENQTINGILRLFEGDTVTIILEQLESCIINFDVLVEGTVEGQIFASVGSSGSTGNAFDPVIFDVNCDSVYNVVLTAGTTAS